MRNSVAMRCIVIIFLLSLCLDESFTENNIQTIDENEGSRTKRNLLPLGIPLVFTYGGTYKLIVGMITPVRAKDFINLVFAVNFQYQYVELANITEVTKYYFHSREQRDIEVDSRKYERLTFYKAVEEMFNSKGFNGAECVRRAICEAAQYPVEEEALVGEIIHILLTPNYGRSQLDDKDETWKSLMSEYLSAQTAGSQMFHCASIYAQCPEGQGILELISELHNE